MLTLENRHNEHGYAGLCHGDELARMESLDCSLAVNLGHRLPRLCWIYDIRDNIWRSANTQ